MQDVEYPVWAQPNVGAGTMMMPGDEDYIFKNAEYVDEYPIAQEGTELNKKYIDSTFNANMDKRWVQRLYEKNPKFYLEGQTDPSTHFMESGDSMVYPLVTLTMSWSKTKRCAILPAHLYILVKNRFLSNNLF